MMVGEAGFTKRNICRGSNNDNYKNDSRRLYENKLQSDVREKWDF